MQTWERGGGVLGRSGAEKVCVCARKIIVGKCSQGVSLLEVDVGAYASSRLGLACRVSRSFSCRRRR